MSDTITLVGPNGERLSPLPVTYLTHEEAIAVREYAEWAGNQGYQAVMVCGKCRKDMECYVQGDIGIFCGCRTLVHKAS